MIDKAEGKECRRIIGMSEVLGFFCKPERTSEVGEIKTEIVVERVVFHSAEIAVRGAVFAFGKVVGCFADECVFVHAFGEKVPFGGKAVVKFAYP